MGATIIVWLSFLGVVGWVIHRWGEDGGNAIWLGGIIFINVGCFISLFLPRFG